ncbi:MAG: nucleoside deaminase [Myxococcota bacterium]
MSKRTDRKFMRRALEIARASEAEGNLPIGCVITLDGDVIAEGHSAVLEPNYNPGNHAEILAIRHVDEALWPRAGEMTCYTTLEPCVMCAGTLLLHGFGRVVFGAHDVQGGAGETLDHLPPYYDEGGVYAWEGPLMPEQCDPLYRRADRAFADLPVGKNQWSDQEEASLDQIRADLERWQRGDEGAIRTSEARKAAAELLERLPDEDRIEALPFARDIFVKTGYLKDYRTLRKYARHVGHLDVLEEVDDAVREALPDIWIEGALRDGRLDDAIACWYEFEDHRRARHCADALIAAADEGHAELIISCRMSQVNYRIGRRSRRHYRRACAILRKLKDELARADAADYWSYVLEDVREQYASRPALLDELDKAGFVRP